MLLPLMVLPLHLSIAVALPVQDSARPLTRPDLEAFFDGLIPRELSRWDIAGAVVSVVKDGRIMLAKGYGYSDVAHRIAPSADTTLFRVASISKTFNATAVMQLVERGQLDLDRTITEYLDFELPTRYQDPITLRHLLTHTAGFEESAKQLAADSGETVSLARFMRETPAQIYRPGTVTAYSNYGADLAGYIVERVSGLPFAEYIRVHILTPLGMRHSSFAEPLPPQLRPLLSKEYAVASDSARDFEVLQGEPSGNLSSTAADMSRFMIAHLQSGRSGNGRILADSTARLMATTQFRTHPAVNGMAMGFFEESRDGYRIIGHGGDLTRFHSHMSLLLDEGVGIFISYNSAGSGGGFYGPREVVRDAFMKRYFPPKRPPEPVVSGDADARKVAGPYLLSRRGETTLFRVVSLAIPLRVVPEDNGSVHIPFLTGANGQPVRWYPIGDLVFRTEDGAERIAFVTDSGGAVRRMAFLGGHELHRARGGDNVVRTLWLIGTSLAILLLSLLLWPVAGLIRRRYHQRVPDDGVSPGLRGLTRVVAFLDLACLATFALIFALVLGETIKPDPGMDPLVRASQALGVLGLLGSLGVLVACIRSWTRGLSTLARLKYAALVYACGVFGWFVLHWNVLVWNLDF